MPSLREYLFLEQKAVDEILCPIEDIQVAANEIKNGLGKLVATKAIVPQAKYLGVILQKDYLDAKTAYQDLNSWIRWYQEDRVAGQTVSYSPGLISFPADQENVEKMDASRALMFEKVIAAKQEAMEKTSYTAGSLLGIEDCIGKNCVEDIQRLVKQIKGVLAAAGASTILVQFVKKFSLTSEPKNLELKSLGANNPERKNDEQKDPITSLLEDTEKMLGRLYAGPQEAYQVLGSLAEKSKPLCEKWFEIRTTVLDPLKVLQKSLRAAAESAKIRQELGNLPPELRKMPSTWQEQLDKPEPPIKRHTFKSSSQTAAAGVADVPTSQADRSESPTQPPAANAEETAAPVEANPAVDTSLESTAQARPTPAPRKAKAPTLSRSEFFDEQPSRTVADLRKFFEESQKQQQEASCQRSPKP